VSNLVLMDTATAPVTPRSCSEWRCTYPDIYDSDCPGRDDPRARQGHYVLAYTSEQASLLVRGTGSRARVQVEEWKRFDEKGRVTWRAT